MTDTSMTDIRDVFFESFLKRFELNDNMVFLTVDMGSATLKKLSSEAQKRYFNVGVSEANAVTVACGLASSGILPVVYGITPFLVSRARAQLRHDFSIGGKKMLLIGSGVGLTYAEDGPSHHSLDDISLIGSLPNFDVATPLEKITAEITLDQFLDEKRSESIFVRLDKGPAPALSKNCSNESIARSCLTIRRGDRQSAEVHVTATPDIFNELIKTESPNDIVFVYSISASTIEEIQETLAVYSSVVVVDESDYRGGLSNIVRASIINSGTKLIDKSLRVDFVQEKHTRKELRKLYQL